MEKDMEVIMGQPLNSDEFYELEEKFKKFFDCVLNNDYYYYPSNLNLNPEYMKKCDAKKIYSFGYLHQNNHINFPGHLRENYNLYVKGIIPIQDEINKQDGNYFLDRGLYYDDIGICNHMTEQNYFSAISFGNDKAMYHLGLHFKSTGRPSIAKNYFLMAINSGNNMAMYELGCYYREIKNYDLMEKYFLMAFENGNIMSIYGFGCYFRDIKNYNLMKKYFILAFENGYTDVMFELANYYQNIEKKNKFIADYCYVLCAKKDPIAFVHNINVYRYPNWNIKFQNKENIYVIIDNMCSFVCSNKMDIEDFYSLVFFIFRFLNIGTIKTSTDKQNIKNKFISIKNEITIKNLDGFLTFISKILYGKGTNKVSKRINQEKKEIIQDIINMFSITSVDDSQDNNKLNINEILKIEYDEYLADKYKPGGKIYLKAKKDFEKRSK
jgi:hypothetical protein